MIGDRIIILPEHEKKASYALSKVVKAYKKTNRFVLGLAGISGTGKTECSTVLQELLWTEEKIKGKIISIDDYYKSSWIGRDIVRKKTGIIGKDEINWKKLNKIVEDFKTGKRKLYTQRIHKFLNSIEHCINDTKSIDILIIEGLYAAYVEADYKVYLDATVNDTLDFRTKRKKENEKSKFRQMVVEKEAQCVVQSKKNCNLIIPWRLK